MNEYLIRYRTKTGTADYLVSADTVHEAEDKFHEDKGWALVVNGVYQRQWMAVG